MANRILRDTTDSFKVNQLSPRAEVLFYRLFMKSDDYGLYIANPKLLRSNLFPLRSDSIRETDISLWLTELVNTKNEKGEIDGLIALYEVNNKPYLEIKNFGQRLRNMKSKYPLPPTIVSGPPPETETESEKKQKPETEAPSLDVFMDYAKANTGSDFDSLKKNIELKYKSWVANGWKTGKDHPIKNWKTTLLNTIPHIPKEKISGQKESVNKTYTLE